MREIKFRFWDKKREVMLYECVISGFTVDLCHPFNVPPTTHLISMQFIDLKDKNGKEIYDGDIVRAYESTGDEYNTVHQIRYFADSSDYPAFDIFPTIDTDCNGISYLVAGEGEIEVIGNIYENPKLLEQAK